VGCPVPCRSVPWRGDGIDPLPYLQVAMTEIDRQACELLLALPEDIGSCTRSLRGDTQ
jgi:hypothetical protein